MKKMKKEKKTEISKIPAKRRQKKKKEMEEE